MDRKEFDTFRLVLQHALVRDPDAGFAALTEALQEIKVEVGAGKQRRVIRDGRRRCDTDRATVPCEADAPADSSANDALRAEVARLTRLVEALAAEKPKRARGK